MPPPEYLSGFIGGLNFIEGDDFLGGRRAKPTHEELRGFLFAPEAAHDMDSVLSRYKEINENTAQLHIVPNEPLFLDKLIWPLRHAKSSYILGNYLGSIALCGMVCEMLAVLLHDMAPTTIADKAISSSEQKKLFGSDFEGLRQSRRLDVLLVMGTINKEQRGQLGDVAGRRNKYLHALSQQHDQLSKDAIEVLKLTSSLVVSCLGFSIAGYGASYHPFVMAYLRAKGLLKPAEGSGSAESET